MDFDSDVKMEEMATIGTQIARDEIVRKLLQQVISSLLVNITVLKRLLALQHNKHSHKIGTYRKMAAILATSNILGIKIALAEVGKWRKGFFIHHNQRMLGQLEATHIYRAAPQDSDNSYYAL